jgi:hypothetical protein
VMVRKGILDLGDITKSFKHVEYPARWGHYRAHYLNSRILVRSGWGRQFPSLVSDFSFSLRACLFIDHIIYKKISSTVVSAAPSINFDVPSFAHWIVWNYKKSGYPFHSLQSYLFLSTRHAYLYCELICWELLFFKA